MLSLKELLIDASEIYRDIAGEIKPVKLLGEYLRQGYYPFYKEDRSGYLKRLSQTVNTVLETDIAAVQNIDYRAVINMKKLLALISSNVPFKPNVQKLSSQIGLSRETMIRYMQYLAKADIIQLLYSSKKGISQLNKPEKVYLHNPNMIFSLCTNMHNEGNMRETFFLNQLSAMHHLSYPDRGDFMVDHKYLFEVGGKNKTFKQIAGINNAYVAADNIEISFRNKLPLWLFGFLY